MHLDFKRNLSFRLKCSDLLGFPGDGLGIVPQQERRLLGAGEDAVGAFADDGKAARRGDQRTQAIGGWMHLELRELAGLGLQP